MCSSIIFKETNANTERVLIGLLRMDRTFRFLNYYFICFFSPKKEERRKHFLETTSDDI